MHLPANEYNFIMALRILFKFPCGQPFANFQQTEWKKKKWKIVLKAFFSLPQWATRKKTQVVQIYGGKLSILRAQTLEWRILTDFHFHSVCFGQNQMQRCIFQRNSKKKRPNYCVTNWICGFVFVYIVCASHRKEKMSFSARTRSWAQLYHSHSLSCSLCLSAKDYRCH